MSSDAAGADRSTDARGVPSDGDPTSESTVTPGAPAKPGSAVESSAEPRDAFGRRGWVLVGVVVTATLLVPAVIYAYPTLLAGRVPFLVAMLALPFVPAVLLGATAVWSMSTSARGASDDG